MFEVAVKNLIPEGAPSAGSLRALIRSTFDGEASRIRCANTQLSSAGTQPEGQVEYLCRLKLDLIADAPIRVVATSRIPAVAVTRAIQRAQSVLNGRRTASNNNRPIHDHLAA